MRTDGAARPLRFSVAHRILLGFLVLTLLLMLAVEGIAADTTGRSGISKYPAGIAPLAHAGPVLYEARGSLVSRAARPGKQIALTFDDGPSPTWTPRIAAVLYRFHVPATFFVIGSRAARYPGVVARLQREGFELGNHTFTHVDPAVLSGWELHMQVDVTEDVLAGIVGYRTRLFRPPYSSTPDAVDQRHLAAYRDLAGKGYVITLANYTSNDWSRPGVRAIVRNSTPRGNRGGIVMFHDGGGDRTQTVRALTRLIPALERRGFRFVTVSHLAGLSRRTLELPAASSERLRGTLVLWTLATARVVTETLAIVVGLLGLLSVLRMVAVAGLAIRHSRQGEDADPGFTPPVSVVVPAYNEVVGIAATVRAIAASDYPDLELIVVDDGSTDGTADAVTELELPGVRVIRQQNGGKSAALNHGIAAARHVLIVTVDADTLLEPDAIGQLVQPFRAADVGAVSGNTKVGNRGGLIGRWQHIEYVMGFNLDRRMYEQLGFTPTVPGAIGAFRRQAIEQIGGFSGATMAEDTDATLAIGRAGWRIAYAERARAWTETPSTLSALWRQRYRWAYGILQSLWKHRGSMVRRGEGRVGRRAIPYLLVFQVLLPCAGPLVDVFAIYGLIFLNPLVILAFWLGFNLAQLALAALAFRLDGEPLGPLWSLPLQQFVYRQLMYLVVFESAVSALRGARLPWMHSVRTGAIAVGGGTGAPSRPHRVRRTAALAGLAACGLAALVPTAGSLWAASPPSNPFQGARFYVDRSSDAWRAMKRLESEGKTGEARLLAKIATRPQADWFGDWNVDVSADVAADVETMASEGALPVLVAYDIPLRDCGGYSSGGARSGTAYLRWIEGLKRGVGGHRAAVILEPDGLAGLDCLKPAQRSQRLALIRRATSVLSTGSSISVYLDAGNESWQTAQTMARRLREAGVAKARGFVVNVSNFYSTREESAYGDRISASPAGSTSWSTRAATGAARRRTTPGVTRLAAASARRRRRRRTTHSWTPTSGSRRPASRTARATAGHRQDDGGSRMRSAWRGELRRRQHLRP